MAVTITIDNHYMTLDDGEVPIQALKTLVDPIEIGEPYLEICYNIAARGRYSKTVDYATATVNGTSPTSAAHLKKLILDAITMSSITIADGANLDAFSRLRVSNPANLFNTQCQYDTDPLQMETGSTGDGSTPSHSANDRMVALSTAPGSGTSFIQSYQYIPYQPSKSQFIAITGLLGAGVAGTTTDVGYFDDNNGIFLRQEADQLKIIRRTSTGGGGPDDSDEHSQDAWNIDPMDGSGPSAKTLDINNVFILIIDLQFLGMGRVRVGLDIDGIIYYVHEFLNANVLTTPYMQTGTLPIQMLVTASGSGSEKTSYFKCAAVNSEGGFEADIGYLQATTDVAYNSDSGAQTHAMTIRPKTTFNGLTNRSLFILEDVDIIVTGNNSIFWELYVGAALTGAAFGDIDSTYSAFEIDTTATLNLASAKRIQSGYAPSSNQNKGQITARAAVKYPITLDRAGANRNFGQLTLVTTGIGGASNTRASIAYSELR